MLEKLQPIKKIYSNYSIFYIFEVISPHSFFKRNLKNRKLFSVLQKKTQSKQDNIARTITSSAPLNPFFLRVTTYSSTFFLRWDFRSVSAGTEVATKTKQREPTVPIKTTAAAKCCTDHHCVAMVIDRQLQLDAHTGS